MKHIYILTASVFLLAAGCARIPTSQQLNTIKTVATEAAYVGTALRLEKQPDTRAQFGVAMSALDILIRKGDYTPGALQAALKNLPALAGASGAVVESGAVLFIVVSGFVPIDTAPRVQAVAQGILAGMERAMARPTGPATRALAAPLPNPCVVPATR